MIYGPDHAALADKIDRLVDDEINPLIDAWEDAGSFPVHALFRKLGGLGLLGLDKPTQFGGTALDYSFTVRFAESLGRIRCGGVPLSIGVHTDMATPALARFGSDALRTEFLAPAIAGDQVACLGITEREAGSDVAAIRTAAIAEGGDYVVTGEKIWVANGAGADWMCCLANTSDGLPHQNKSLFVIPLNTVGVTRGPPQRKIGMDALDTSRILLDGVRIPKRFRIGEEGAGFRYQMLQFQQERLWGIAATLMPLQYVLDTTVDYARGRQVFGRPVLHNQAVQFRLAELQTELELLRSLLYRATEAFVSGEDVTVLASMGKLKAGRLSRELSDACLQYWGGQGYAWETPVARYFRDGRAASIGGGADEIMLTILSRKLGYFQPAD